MAPPSPPGGSTPATPFVEPPPVTPRRNKEPTEKAKYLPVGFVVGVIVTLYCIYVFVHCRWMLQVDTPPFLRDAAMTRRVYIELAVFHVITVLLVICYIRCIMVHPGEVPEMEEWKYQPKDLKDGAKPEKEDVPNLNLHETKRTGERRHCKWCAKYKPDRCHHCRACRTCILKMDHHCPWIYNCVGFKNHKYFFLLLFYSAVDCHIIAWTMLETVKDSIEVETPFLTMFLLLFGCTLANFLGLLVTTFWMFHVWLATKAMTTIEFCEKSLKKTGYDSSAYDEGVFQNFKAVLGPHLFLWPLPLSPPSGDGLTYVSEHSRLVQEEDRRTRRHRTTPRADFEKGNISDGAVSA